MLYTADFETNNNKDNCQVWAWAICGIISNEFYIGNTLTGFMEAIVESGDTLYFHNLKFDGNFILNWLLKNGYKWQKENRKMNDYSFTTVIADTGQWYNITICRWVQEKRIYTYIYDSLKILPMSVKAVAKAFGLKMTKGEINYNLERYEGWKITEKERDYIFRDTKIMADAMRIMLESGMDKMTIGGNALADYKKRKDKQWLKQHFPPLTIEMDRRIRYAYKGGWTYLNENNANYMSAGIVLDVNSLYPWAMRYKPMPVGIPIEFSGKYAPNEKYPLYIQVLKCQFELKKGYLPTIQLKHNLRFTPTEYLKSSEDEFITLTLTNIDLEIMMKHYDVFNIEYMGGFMFKESYGLFDDYIDFWMEEKIKAGKENNAGLRTQAKLMLNNLYGKYGTNPIRGSKRPYLDEDGFLRFANNDKEEGKTNYVPVACFITAWARWKTITSAQKCYDRFVYADTDSLHLKGVMPPSELETDDFKLGAWKIESRFLRCKYLRAKTYMEKIWDREECCHKWNIKCAGMPAALHSQVTPENFEVGAVYEGKLRQTRVIDGIVLEETTFQIR